jgi:hypothetical protein
MRRLSRHLFTLCSAVSLLLCVATCVAWLAAAVWPREFNHRVVERTSNLVVRHYGGFGWNASAFALRRYEDHLLFGQEYDRAFRRVGVATEADVEEARLSEAAESQEPPHPLNFDGGRFQYEHRTRFKLYIDGRRHKGYGRWTVLVMPFARVFVATSVLPAAGIVLLGWRRLRGLKSPGYCPQCGCDLRASPDGCPECGTAAK